MKLEVNGLGKEFDGEWVLRDLDLEMESGIYGLLGPNGAGKSTLMELITTFLDPTEGSIRWKGSDVHEDESIIREKVGYLPQDFGVCPNLTAEEFLKYLGSIREVDNVDERCSKLLKLVNLQNDKDKRLEDFSGGMRQRVGIAQAMLSDPKLLIVDEPTVGLDPVERVHFRNMISELADDRIIILSTHIVSDIESTASKAAILHNGRVLKQDKVQNIIEESQGSVWELKGSERELEQIRDNHDVVEATQGKNGLKIWFIADEPLFEGAEPVEPSLEDAYIHLIGEDALE